MGWIDDMSPADRASLRDAGRIGNSRFDGPRKCGGRWEEWQTCGLPVGHDGPHKATAPPSLARQIVDEQAEGEALWFCPRSAPRSTGPTPETGLTSRVRLWNDSRMWWCAMTADRPPVSGEPRTARRFEDDAPDGRISDVGGESALIATLSDAMAEKLARNRGKRHWNDAAPNYLIERLRQEVDELEQAIGCYLEEGSADEDDVWSEAADVGNFAAMLADNATGRSEARAEVLDGTAKSQEASAAPPALDVERLRRDLYTQFIHQGSYNRTAIWQGIDHVLARLSAQPGEES